MIFKTFFLTLFPFVFFHEILSACTPSANQCGCSVVKPLTSQSKIVGGFTARNHSWPWLVSLRRGKAGAPTTDPGSAFCGGTLINEEYVLTAAHCFNKVKSSDLSLYFVVAGARFREDISPVRLDIKRVIMHNRFNEDTFENDIALLQLTSKISFNDSRVSFVCLPSSNMLTYPDAPLNGTVAGWGRLSQGGLPSDTLQQVELPVLSNINRYCIDVINNNKIQFCAGVIEGGKDTCQGDSGGPFMVNDRTNDTWTIAGITSYGYGCAVPDYPGVYTRVSMYIDWISAQINSTESGSKRTVFSVHYGIIIFLSRYIYSVCD